MFENFNEPITEQEYNSALDAAINKYKRITVRAEPDTGDKFNIEYLKLLLQEQLLQDRYSKATIFEHKKRNTPKSAPMNTIIIPEFELSVKGVFSNV